MKIANIIHSKANGRQNSPSEIKTIIHAYSDGHISDPEMRTWLEAVYIFGMNDEEILALVNAMIDSGNRLNFTWLKKGIVDKHSTGGVGDKVSLVLAPILAACGLAVPMIAGRSLGHTGGTLDKLASIPGYKTNLSIAEFSRNVERVGVSIIGQTDEICPADRRMYALRDETNTIVSNALICGSIMSKKIAAGIDSLVINITVGNGAFMKTIQDGKNLGKKLMFVGKKFGLPTSIVYSNMNEPLGTEAGLWNEVQESVACLKGNGDQNLMKVVKALAKPLLEIRGHKNWAEDFRVAIDSGLALLKLEEMIEAHHGDPSLLHKTKNPYQPRSKKAVIAKKSGFVTRLNTKSIGWVVNDLTVLDEGEDRQLDHSGGVRFEKKLGDEIQSGETLAVCHGKYQGKVQIAAKKILSYIEIGDESVDPGPVIL